MVKDLNTAFSDWMGNVETIMSTAGTSVDGFNQTVQTAVYGDGEDNQGIMGASQDAVTGVQNLGTAMSTAFG
jgi:hypothetical protein